MRRSGGWSGSTFRWVLVSYSCCFQHEPADGGPWGGAGAVEEYGVPTGLDSGASGHGFPFGRYFGGMTASCLVQDAVNAFTR
jgi:hypothetical protein